MGVKGAARATAAGYCRGYWLVAALTPLNFLAYDLCSADGGHRCCRLASVSNIVLKLAAVVPAFTAVSTLQLIQYATAVSAQPLVDVYLGEGNNRRVKTVARMGIAVTFAYGLLPGAVLLAFPGLVPSFIGLTDPGLLPYARTAVRIGAAFLPLSLVCGFMDSFYIYTERFALSVVLILMDSCVAPILLGVGLGWLFGANGACSALRRDRHAQADHWQRERHAGVPGDSRLAGRTAGHHGLRQSRGDAGRADDQGASRLL